MPEFLDPQQPTTKVTPATKKPSIRDIGEAFAAFFKDLAREPGRAWKKIWYKVENIPLINFQMAEQFIKEDKINDAIFRLKVTLRFAPSHVQSWYLLGSCYDRIGKRDKALEALSRAMTLAPNHAGTHYLIATIDQTLLPPQKRPRTVPKEMVIEFFEKLAPEYEEYQRQLHYIGHELAANAAKERMDSRITDYAILDLGCGTGLVGAQLADYAARLVGVDVTKGMGLIAASKRRADERRSYNQVVQQDMRDFLAAYQEEPFDLVTAAHCFNYVGDLQAVFSNVSRVLKPGGWFIFQVEPYKQEGFGLIPGKGRFGHSEAYIQQLLASTGFDVLNYSMVPIFPNFSIWQYIVRKQ